jgi:membrane fusion protein, copper/silver efflux system
MSESKNHPPRGKTVDDDNSARAARPAGGHAARRALVAALVGALAAGGGVYATMRLQRTSDGDRQGAHGGAAATPAGVAPAPVYRCPMHPTITSDKPGDCPICGMKLMLVSADGPDASAPKSKPAPRHLVVYRSPMDPHQTSPVPRKDEMGMDYLPVYSDELPGGDGPATETRGTSVPGLAAVTIDPARQQMIGLRTAVASRGAIANSWRTVGRVEVDPTGVRRVNLKIEGYVERVFVDFVGKPVRKGQPLMSVYSPSLLVAEEELVLAVKTRQRFGDGGLFGANGDDLVMASRRRLQLWDVPDAEIARLERTGEPAKSVTFVSPIAGVVTVKNVVEGATLKPGDTPYEITDLRMVWVMADAYESDLARVRVGMPAALTLPSYPNRVFNGRVEFIDPVLNPATRTTKMHLHFANADAALKPEMFGEVVLQEKPRVAVRVPADAIIHTGTKDVVFLALGAGRFSPRQVQLGARDGDRVEVVSGVDEGQSVVIRANFLVDSESRLRASLAAIGSR